MVEIANYLQRPQHIRSDLVPLLALMVVKMYKVKVTYDTTLSGPLIIKTNNEGTNVKSEFHWYELFYGRIVPTLVKIIERDSSEKASLIAKSHIFKQIVRKYEPFDAVFDREKEVAQVHTDTGNAL